jgi:hypothetical protein
LLTNTHNVSLVELGPNHRERQQHPRYGYLMLHGMLRTETEGVVENPKLGTG